MSSQLWQYTSHVRAHTFRFVNFVKSHHRCGTTLVHFSSNTNAKTTGPVQQEGLRYDMQMDSVQIDSHKPLK